MKGIERSLKLTADLSRLSVSRASCRDCFHFERTDKWDKARHFEELFYFWKMPDNINIVLTEEDH